MCSLTDRISVDLSHSFASPSCFSSIPLEDISTPQKASRPAVAKLSGSSSRELLKTCSLGLGRWSIRTQAWWSIHVTSALQEVGETIYGAQDFTDQRRREGGREREGEEEGEGEGARGTPQP